jgi:glycosyltransferase involved in cell wall biosynthesis
MKVAFDGRSIHRNMGGIGRAALELCRATASARGRHALTLLLGRSAPELTIEGVEIVPVDAAMIDEPFEQLRLPPLLDQLGADLYFNPTFSVPAIKTTRLQVSVIHDVVFEERPQWVEPGLRTYLSRWSRFAAAEADHVVTVSDDARRRIRKVYGVEDRRTTRIYNGVSPAGLEPATARAVSDVRRKYRLEAPYVLYLGSIEPKKGVAELIDVFPRLGFPGVLVLAGGQGGMALDLPRAPFLRHLGYVPEEDKKALIQAASLFVYPSRYEGFGLPPLEAMALGVPCVVGSETSLPEVVDDVALTADVSKPELFARTLIRGLKDVEFRARAAKAGPKRARRFTWERSAAEFLKLCDELEAA